MPSVKPRKDRTTVTPVAGAGSANPSSPHAILVVDDDRDTVDTIAVLLEATGMGVTVVPAYSAREGLDRLDDRPEIRLVISDIRMPGVDGFDFLRVVKHRFPAVPTVLTTGLPITNDDVVPWGALILHKPFAVDDLKRMVAEQLRICLDDPPGPA
jgi:two-component system, cell cycle sensor histidine kinase and response regulator CckA